MKRYFEQFDIFKTSFYEISQKNSIEFISIKNRLDAIEKNMASGVKLAELDPVSKRYLKALVRNVKSTNEKVERMNEDYGQVRWLKDEFKKQDRKLVTLYLVAKKLVNSKDFQHRQDAQSPQAQRGKN